ncbi:MAG: iron-containing redox enzyme family protein [Myxococcales bacterium FL481]|nr:MAG: iron-containing redox enzyme family protein [Myxococcales bacterium FL481]
MQVDVFRERLLSVMERKHHWAWPAFTGGLVAAEDLHIHLEQEYETYVRDFPRLLGHAYVQCDVPAVRRELAENLYEEETGGLVAGRPHPELFLEYPRGLGMDLERFERIELLPAAARYRAWLDEASQSSGWPIGATVLTIFVEGTPHERGELDSNAPRRPEPPLSEHPLVRHYGLSLECLALTKAHRQVEGEHRAAAWRIVLHHVPVDQRETVVDAMERSLEAWSAYRDAIAAACRLNRMPDGSPQRRAG